MNKIKMMYPIFEILLGISMFIYGGFDDSPGGQLLGLVAVIFGVKNIIKKQKNSK